MLEGQSKFSREGPLSAWLVSWLMLFQRLSPAGTLKAAVGEIRLGSARKLVRPPVGKKTTKKKKKKLSRSTSAYSQARTKLPLVVAETVSDLIFESRLGEPKTLPGLGLPMFLLDGSSIQLQHTPALVQAYPPSKNRHGESHWPVMRILVAHDVVTGLALRPEYGPMYGPKAVSEQGLAKKMIGRLLKRSVAMGDRNFGIFSIVYHVQLHDHLGLFRLTDQRAAKVNGSVTPNAGTDRRVRWTPSRWDLRSNPEIPADACVEGRLLAFKLRDEDGKPIKLYLFTTLDLPADEILKLYGYRWYVETDLRSLKRDAGLHRLTAKSVAMVAKELVLGVAAYNLVRGTISDAATALNCDPRRFSFSQALQLINEYLPAFAYAANEAERQELRVDMLEAFAQSKIPRRRKSRSFPREIWPPPCSFPTRKAGGKESAPLEKSEEKKVA